VLLAGLRAAARDRKSREADRLCKAFTLWLLPDLPLPAPLHQGPPSGHADANAMRGDSASPAGHDMNAVRELKSIQCAPEHPAAACMQIPNLSRKSYMHKLQNLEETKKLIT